MNILRPPYIKSKGFCPNPVAKYGVPWEANSVANSKCIGTPQWEDYWNTQLYYIKNGYQTGGVFIPGRYYYYLNFNTMATVSGMIAPDMVDLHLELSYLIDWCKKEKKHLIVAKKRRAGISEFTHKALIDYGWRFTNGAYNAGIAAGKENFAQDLIRKWRANESFLPPELRIKKLKDNSDEIIAGYKLRNDMGELVEGGTRNTIYLATMGRDPALFKGKFLSDIIAEECGEFEHLQKFYAHSRPCIMDGSKTVGFMCFYGTGGNLNKGGRDFEIMWDEAEANGFVKFLIQATRFHKPFYGGYSDNGTPAAEIPYLLKDMKPWEANGVEDLKASEEFIIKERAVLLKELKNKLVSHINQHRLL